MGEQFFEVFKPKKSDGPGTSEGGAATEAGGAAEPAVQSESEDLGYVRDYAQAAGISRPATPGDERSITFRFEEVVVLLIGAMMLMVISFLLGWYGNARGQATTLVASPGGSPAAATEPPEELGDIRSFDPKPLEVKPRGKEARVEKLKPPPKPSKIYSLQVIRFPAGDTSSAGLTKKRLESRGYAPVFLQTHGREIAVYVGRFTSKEDPRIERFKREIQRISRAYKWCDLKTVQ